MAKNQRIEFSIAEQKRIHDAARALATSHSEFIHWAVLHATDEVLGINYQIRLRNEKNTTQKINQTYPIYE